MRVFQTPGSDEQEAEWLYLFDASSDTRMGWYKHLEGSRWLVLILRDTRGWDAVKEPLYAYGIVLDLDAVTLPERKDMFPEQPLLVGERLLLRELVSAGRGQVIVSAPGKTPNRVRKDVKEQLDKLIASGVSPLAATDGMHHRRWGELLDSDPAEYHAGFLLGFVRGDSDEDMTPAFDAGWRHGWECAVGRANPPEWFQQRRALKEPA